MIAYKLCRKKRNGEITPLFINKKQVLNLNIWYNAESHPTEGYAFRPFWHSTHSPHAPHLSMNGRVWIKVEIKYFEIIERPISQGGTWYLSKKIKLIEIIS